jgi:hypothetical protein
MGIIFTPNHCQMIATLKKTQTRRAVGNKPCYYKVGSIHAVMPGRGQFGVYLLMRTQELIYPDNRASRWMVHRNTAMLKVRVRIATVRQEPLHAISEADARAEGYDSIAAYAEAWDKINGKKRGCRWADNPSVWVISFESLSTGVNQPCPCSTIQRQNPSLSA